MPISPRTNRIPELTPRLAMAAELAGQGDTVADIGTDHALLPARLLLAGKYRKALLCDIVPGPLLRAQKTVCKYGLGEVSRTVLCAGFAGLKSEEFDCATVCGMGGLNIISLLANDPWAAKKRLVLQPQTDVVHLRAYLRDCGYVVLCECAVREKSRCYIAMAVTAGESFLPLPADNYIKFDFAWCADSRLWMGALDARDPNEVAYLQHTVRLYKPMAEGLRLSELEKSAAIEAALKHIEEELK